jgi:hypothetical protein
MNNIIVRSPRRLSRPRQYAITRPSPAAAILKSLAAAVVQGVHGATALAIHVQQTPTVVRRQTRWVDSRQVENPELPAPVATPAPAEPSRVQLRKFLDIFD